MFTGIIDHCAVILHLQQHNNSASIWIKTQFTDLILGESIAVNGVCLTVAELNQGCFRCDISSETLMVTTLKHCAVDGRVNVERALRYCDRLGGHFVTGHVDDVATVSECIPQGEYVSLRFRVGNLSNLVYIVKKGSIAINGVSLTINQQCADGFSCMLIPLTLQKTNLNSLEVGALVNIEFDYLAKLVQQKLEPHR